jgi:hypothetical protein
MLAEITLSILAENIPKVSVVGLSALTGRYDDGDVISLTRRAVNNPSPALQSERVGL